MHSRKFIAQLVAACAVTLFAGSASAQEDWELGDPGAVQPAPEPAAGAAQETSAAPVEGDAGEAVGPEGVEAVYASRGITLAEGTLRVDVGPYEHGINDSGIILGPFGQDSYGIRVQHFGEAGSNDNLTLMGIGAAYGVFDELEVGALVVPVLLSPNGAYADMAVYGRYAFFKRDWIEIGGQLAMSFPTGRFSNVFGLGFGAPVVFRFGDLRIDTGLELELGLHKGDDQYVGLDVPIAATYNITQSGFVGGHLALTAYDFQGLVVPLGVHGGYTLITDSVVVDFTGKATFFLATDPVDPFTPEFQFVFGANVHFDVGPHRGA
jgi:hypothetical protein